MRLVFSQGSSTLGLASLGLSPEVAQRFLVQFQVSYTACAAISCKTSMARSKKRIRFPLGLIIQALAQNIRISHRLVGPSIRR